MIGRDSIIHIGAPRTATTFLQEYYYNELEDVCFLGYSHEKRFSFDEVIEPLSFKNTASVDDDMVAGISQFIKDSNPERKKVVISFEGFFDSVNGNHFRLANSCANLKKAFTQPKIIFTFRRQDSYIESYYRTCVFDGFYTSPKDFLGYKDGKFDGYDQRSSSNIDVTALNWGGVVDYLDETFGKENVLALPYEMFRADPQNYTSIISDFIGTDNPSIDYTLNPNAASFNKKYYALSVMRVLNRFANNRYSSFPIIIQDPLKSILPEESPEDSFLVKKMRFVSRNLSLRTIARLLSMIPQKKKNFFGPEICAKILELHRASNVRLSDRLGFDLSEYGY